MPMKISVSMRVAEDMSDKRKAAMSLEDMARMTKDSGFHAVCMRASQVGTHTPSGGRQGEARVPGLARPDGLDGDGRLPHTGEQRARPRRAEEHHPLPRSRRSPQLRPAPHLHEDGRRHRMGAARVGRGGGTEYPPGPPEPPQQPLRACGTLGRGHQASPAAELRHHLRAREPPVVRRGLRCRDDQDVRALPDERILAEPDHKAGRRYGRRHLERRSRGVRPGPHMGRTGDRLPAHHGRPERDRLRGVRHRAPGIGGGAGRPCKAAITENARYLRSIGDFEE